MNSCADSEKKNRGGNGHSYMSLPGVGGIFYNIELKKLNFAGEWCGAADPSASPSRSTHGILMSYDMIKSFMSHMAM